MEHLAVTHVATEVTTLGGLQAILRHHLAHEAEHGVRSDCLALFERIPRGTPGPVRGAGMGWRTTVRSARAAFRRLGPAPGRIVIYHDAAGLPFCADLDRAALRLGWIHYPAGRVMESHQRHWHLLDGLFSVSPPALEQMRSVLPGPLANRLWFCPVPVEPLVPPPPRLPLAGRPIVLGYSGRLIRPDKRVDRLPELSARLAALGIEHRLEICGSGPMKPWLEAQFGGSPRARLLGDLRGLDYWRVLAGWDFVVFTSDSEGMGISLLEAMSLGVLPLYPRHAGAAAYVQAVAPEFAYPPGDVAAIAEAVRWCRSEEHRVPEWRDRARAAVAHHLGSAHLDVFAGALREMLALPRHSASAFRPRPAWGTDFLPFAVLSRWMPEGFLKDTPVADPS